MPSNTVCFTDGLWTAATPIGHRFAQEPSPQENTAIPGIFYCADGPDWERHPMIAIHISGGNSIRAHSAFPTKLLALCIDLALQKHTNTLHRVVSDCQAAITLLNLCMQDEPCHVQSRVIIQWHAIDISLLGNAWKRLRRMWNGEKRGEGHMDIRRN